MAELLDFLKQNHNCVVEETAAQENDPDKTRDESLNDISAMISGGKKDNSGIGDSLIMRNLANVFKK